MPNLNKVFLMGHLTGDPDLRYTPSGIAITKFDIAINNSFKDRAGNEKKDVCFVSIDAFGKRGEAIAQWLVKGNPIFVEGKLKLDQWKADDGKSHSKLKVIMDNFQFIGAAASKKDSGSPDFSTIKSSEIKDGEASDSEFNIEDNIPF